MKYSVFISYSFLNTNFNVFLNLCLKGVQTLPWLIDHAKFLLLCSFQCFPLCLRYNYQKIHSLSLQNSLWFYFHQLQAGFHLIYSSIVCSVHQTVVGSKSLTREMLVASPSITSSMFSSTTKEQFYFSFLMQIAVNNQCC